MMKRNLIIFLLLSLANLCYAQLGGDGYYRVFSYGLMNQGSKDGVKEKVYMSVVHNEGKVVVTAASADLHAIKLYTDNDFSNPQNVIYFSKVGSNSYDFSAQGASVYSIIGYHPEIKGYSDNRYEFIGRYSGQMAYLWANPSKTKAGYYSLSTGKQSHMDYRLWSLSPISHNTDNYLGVKPTLQVGDKYYAPYYVSFPFRFASAGMKAFSIIHVNDDGTVVINEVDGDVIPAATPVLIECSSANPSDNRLELLTTGGTPLNGNYLSGVYFSYMFSDSQSENKRTQFDPQTMRVFAVKDGELVMTSEESLLNLTEPYYSSEAGKLYLNHNESYLYIGDVSTYSDGKTISGRALLSADDRDMLSKSPTAKVVTTIYSGIENVKQDAGAEAFYSIDGKRLSAPQPGLNIVRRANGTVKKVMY